MTHARAARSLAWPGVVIAVGGALMIVLWVVYTNLHGPTSFNEGGRLLGADPLVWGSLLSGIPNLLIALGLAGLYPILARGAGRVALTGFLLTMVGLVVPAVLDLATLTLGAPLLAPVLAVGLVLLAAGHRRASPVAAVSRQVLLGLGVVLFVAFLWALVPLDISDSVDGYRIFGILSNVMFGAGWAVFGIGVSTARAVE